MPFIFPPFNQKNTYQKGRWLIADLHIHSVYSDGAFSPYQILKYAALHFLDAVAIADHSEIRGALEGKSISDSNPDLPITILAQEVSAGNHLHFLMVNSRESHSGLTWDNLRRNIEKHRLRGGIVIWAHPWTMPKAKWVRSCLQELIDDGLIDGIELFNAAALELDDKRRVWQEIWEEWIAPYDLAVMGGSDFHQLQKGRFIGTGRTYLKVYSPGEQGILEALRAKRCAAGLFGSQFIRGDDLSGAGLLWGREPWAGELQRLRDSLQRKLAGLTRINSAYRRLLLALSEMGQYQYLQDLL